MTCQAESCDIGGSMNVIAKNISAACLFKVVTLSMHESNAFLALSLRFALNNTPLPIGFVSINSSPGNAPTLQIFSG